LYAASKLANESGSKLPHSKRSLPLRLATDFYSQIPGIVSSDSAGSLQALAAAVNLRRGS
jgi:hypothetical protein